MRLEFREEEISVEVNKNPGIERLYQLPIGTRARMTGLSLRNLLGASFTHRAKMICSAPIVCH